MSRRSVVLTKHQEEIVDALVGSGRFRDAGEVVSEALGLFEQRQADEAAKLVALRSAAAAGIEAFDRGAFTEFADGSTLKAHLDGLSARVLGHLDDV